VTFTTDIKDFAPVPSSNCHILSGLISNAQPSPDVKIPFRWAPATGFPIMKKAPAGRGFRIGYQAE